MREHLDVRRYSPLLALLAIAVATAPASLGSNTTRAGVPAGVARIPHVVPGMAHTNATKYVDPTGDASGGPDITNVNVSNDDNGNIHISVEIPSHEQLPSGSFFAFYFDVDKNESTGSTGFGFEYVIWYDSARGTTSLYKWGGSVFQPVAEPSLRAGFLRGETIDISRAAIGSPSSFLFQVGTFKSDGKSSWDRAPDDGRWTYDVVIGTPKPKITAIEVSKFDWTPDPPRAGKALTARARVIITDTGKPVPSGEVHCKASIAGTPLTGSSRFVGGVGSCTWQVPASAAGKTMKGRVTVLYEGFSAWGELNRQVKVPAAPPTLRIKGILTSPQTPRAGSVFFASVGVWVHRAGEKDERITSGSVTCQATANGQRLSVTRAVVLAGGASCGWNVPSSARGATMFVSITVRSRGLSVTKAYRFRVS